MTEIHLYLKYPEEGRVKTRLAAEIGHLHAVEIYRRMLFYLLDKVLSPLPTAQFRVCCYVDPFREMKDYEILLGSYRFALYPQIEGDLGNRLAHSFREGLKRSERVLAIGADCIDITAGHFENAVSDLAKKGDLVLGPATDGGYYLIGLSREISDLFQNISWSTSQVFEQTVAIAKRLNLRWSCLEKLSDVDELKDLPKEGFLSDEGSS